MSGDHVPPAGAVGTGGTLVGLLPRVGPLVGGEMVRPAEDLTTDCAGVRFDPGVKPHVPGQHVTAGETSLTNITKVSLC